MNKILFTLSMLISITCLSSQSWGLPDCTPSNFHNCYGSLNLEGGAKYVGEFKDQGMHGQGTLIFAPGNKLESYVGGFRNGEIHGQGKLTFKNGEIREGIFKNNKFVGPAPVSKIESHTFDNGDVYVGEFKNDQIHGQGKLTTASGVIREGTFKDGEHIQGTYSSINSDYLEENKYVYEGEFQNWGIHGQGKRTYANGKIEEGMFVSWYFVGDENGAKLFSAYKAYHTIRECHDQSILYISSKQMKTAKSKIKNIENYYKNKSKSLDENAIWENSQKKWKYEVGKTLEVFASIGSFSSELQGVCRVANLGLNAEYTPNAKNKTKKKDF
jgi:hypothetical protein